MSASAEPSCPLSPALQDRLRAAGLDPAEVPGGRLAPWDVWLRLRDHSGRRATLVDLYELEAASRGIRPEELTAADRERLKTDSRQVRRGPVEVLPGSGRSGDPHEVTSYDRAWLRQFALWRDQLAVALSGVAARIDHVGSTAVPGLAAKPVIDVQVSVPDVGDEPSYLQRATSAGLILRLREPGHRLLWPPADRPRDVHVHVCGFGSTWEHDHLLFRDYLRAHPAARERYAALKRDLITRWRHDRLAYGQAKTGFVLDTLADASQWAVATGWHP